MAKPQERQPVKALSPELAKEMIRVIAGLQSAIELSQEEPPKDYPFSQGWMAGNALWMRALKNCEATLFLTEQGMDSTAWANLRMAYECLFFSCALWKDPNNFSRLAANHRIELSKQAKGLLKPGVYPKLTEERTASLEKNAAAAKGLTEWKVWQAADEVDMEYFYQMVYRGSGMMGAHATVFSTNAHVVAAGEGAHSLYYGPRFDDAAQIIYWVQELLVLGLNAFKKLYQTNEPPNPK